MPLLLLPVPLWSLVPGFQCPWCPGLEHPHGGLLLPCPRSPDSQALLLPAVCEGEVAPGMVRGTPAVCGVVRFGGGRHCGACRQGPAFGHLGRRRTGSQAPLPTLPSYLWLQMLLPPEAGAAWTSPPAAPRFPGLSCPSQRPGSQEPGARFPWVPLLGGFQPAHLYGQMCGLLWGRAGVSLSCGCPAGCRVKGTDKGSVSTCRHHSATTLPSASMLLTALSSARKWNCTVFVSVTYLTEPCVLKVIRFVV